MQISAENQNRCLILRVQGRLDAFGSKELEREVESKTTDEILCAIVDMGAVDYVSSAALRVLQKLYRKLSRREGTVALANTQDYCLRVLDIAGFSKQFLLFDSAAQALDFCRERIRERNYLEKWEELETAELGCGKARIISASRSPVAIEVLGDIKDVLYSRITVGHLCSKRFSEAEYSIGLGGLGDRTEDYFQIMGEMITIGGTMVWLPSDGHDTPDFLIPQKDSGEVTLRTAFNVSMAGEFNEFMVFESSEDRGTPIDAFYRALFDLSRRRRPDFKGVLGLAMRAQMASVFGSGVKRSPIFEFAPADGQMIIDPGHIEEWFEFDTKSRHAGVTALICGIGADLSADLSVYDERMLNSVFYLHPANIGSKTMLLHNHGVIFTELPMKDRVVSLGEEIRDVVAEGDFIDMRHLLDGSALTRAMIGVSYIQAFRPDPRGNAGL